MRAEYRISESISGVPMLTVLGVIDRSTVGAFCDMLEIAEQRGTRGLIVYLEQTTYLCSRAFDTLALVNARLAGRLNRTLIVVCSGEHVAGSMLRLLAPEILRVPTLVAALKLCVQHPPQLSKIRRYLRLRTIGRPESHDEE